MSLLLRSLLCTRRSPIEGFNNPPSQGPKEGSERSKLCPSRQRIKQSILLLFVAPPGEPAKLSRQKSNLNQL